MPVELESKVRNHSNTSSGGIFNDDADSEVNSLYNCTNYEGMTQTILTTTNLT